MSFVKEVIRLLILDKARFANKFCTSFTVIGLAGMFGSCCIHGDRSRLFTSSWPGRILGLAGTVLRLVGQAGPALRLNTFWLAA